MATIQHTLRLGLVLAALTTTHTLRADAIASPDEILLDGAPPDGRVAVAADGTVTLAHAERASTVTLVWKGGVGSDALVLGGEWERTYGKTAWQKPHAKRPLPWYFLATRNGRTEGWGVAVQPAAFACWFADAQKVTLRLDVRAGKRPVRLNGRRLDLCRVVRRDGKAGESAFAAGRAFCRMMCPKPRLPKAPIYGYNDWYCAYGRNTATNFLADAAAVVALCEGLENRPYVVADDGWQQSDFRGGTVAPERQWAASNATWGMGMEEFVRRVKALDAHPGLWYRPFYLDRATQKTGIDPTDPRWARQIAEDLRRFRAWGVELVKIDFITEDWAKQWFYAPFESPVTDRARDWADDTRTSAEVVRGLYRDMREAAGEAMAVIGCNALDHFAAGLFELQRIGDDTSGRAWERTRKMGPNTLGMRTIQHETFYVADADCVGLAKAGAVAWEKNRQWLDLVARSGTSLFVSWRRELMDDAVRAALKEAFARASRAQRVGEPLDWQETPTPARWRFSSGEATYVW